MAPCFPSPAQCVRCWPRHYAVDPDTLIYHHVWTAGGCGGYQFNSLRLRKKLYHPPISVFTTRALCVNSYPVHHFTCWKLFTCLGARFDILSFVNRDLHSSLLYKFLRNAEKCGFIDLVQFYGEKLEYDSTLIVTHCAVKEFYGKYSHRLVNFLIKEAMFLQQCATVHRTITREHSTGLLFLPITIACCLCITRLGLAKKLWRLAMLIKFRSIRICKTTLDLPSPTNTAVRSQQWLNTPEVLKVSNFYFVNDNLIFDLCFQGEPWPLWPPWLHLWTRPSLFITCWFLNVLLNFIDHWPVD